jgi:hypothetical protein
MATANERRYGVRFKSRAAGGVARLAGMILRRRAESAAKRADSALGTGLVRKARSRTRPLDSGAGACGFRATDCRFCKRLASRLRPRRRRPPRTCWHHSCSLRAGASTPEARRNQHENHSYRGVFAGDRHRLRACSPRERARGEQSPTGRSPWPAAGRARRLQRKERRGRLHRHVPGSEHHRKLPSSR